MPIILTPGAPSWAAQLALAIDGQFAEIEFPKKPVRLPEIVDAAALPAPADWRAGTLFVKSINMVAVSDGTRWRRLDTGATL